MSSLKVCVLRSGSSGNCTAIWTAKSGILIDCAGIGLKEVEKELEDIGLDPSQIKGIVITHGHIDHICNDTLKLADRYGIPIYIHRNTYRVIQGRYRAGKYQLKIIHHTENPFIIDDLRIMPFKTFHDGGYVGEPFGFCIEYSIKSQRHKVGFLTDTSRVSDSMINILRDCKCLIIECNHDTKLAWKKSPNQMTWREHLNNKAAAEALVKIKNRSKVAGALRHIFLAHISERHNRPRFLIGQISNDMNKENITDCDFMLTYRGKRTEIKEIL